MKFSGKPIIILLVICIAVVFFAALAYAEKTSLAEDTPLEVQKLNAIIEVTEYARQAGYTGVLDFDDIHSASDTVAVVAAVNGIKCLVDAAIEAAMLTGAAFDAATNLLLSVPLLTLESFDEIRALRISYDEMSADARVYVTRAAELICLEIAVNELIAEEFLVLQSALPLFVTELTLPIIAQVTALREFYDHYLVYGASELVDDSHFLAIEQTVAALKKIEDDITTAATFDAMINAFPEILTLSEQDAVAAAREAYESLSAEAKTLVEQYDELCVAEDTLVLLSAELEQARTFDALVSALPSVIRFEDYIEVSAARSFYNALPAGAKAFVTEYAVFLAAEARVAFLAEAKLIGDEIRDYIDALTEIELSLEARIIRTRARYEELNDDAKDFVVNYAVLVAAEERIAALKTAKHAAEVFQPRIDALDALIAGTDIKDELSIINAGRIILEVKNDYDALSLDIKDFIKNSAAIDECLDVIGALKDAFDADFVTAMIDGIAEPPTLDDKPIIESARIAYDALSSSAKLNIINYQKLLNSEAVIFVMENEAYCVAAVVVLLEALPDIITLAFDTQIKIARTAYDALTPSEQETISEGLVNTLVAAEALIALLTDNYYKGGKVNRSILALGKITLAKAASVLAAREAYDTLSEGERIFVTDYQILVLAEERLTALAEAEVAAEQAADLIDALPISITLSDKVQLLEARAAYDALSEDGKTFVANYETLLVSEDALFALELAQAATSVEALIDSIPIEIELSEECVNTIAAARAAYDNLGIAEKSAVSNYNILLSADAAYRLLVTLEEARVVSMSIDTLPRPSEVALSDEVNILNVRSAYQALDQEGRAAVLNLGALIAIEERLAELFANSEAAEDFDMAVLALGAIEDINITNRIEIEELRLIYDTLNDEAQDFVTMLSRFQAIEAKLILEILRIDTAVNTVKDIIAAIPRLNELALRNAETVIAARAAYEALEPVAKSLVDNYNVLISAELQIYRLQKYNDFNNSVSRIDYRDYEWSQILMLTEAFIETLFASVEYGEMDAAYSELTAAVGALPTALDHNKTQAKEDIVRYAASIGYKDEINFATIDAALNVYEISEAADIISEYISETRQAQIDAAIEQATYDIGHYITDRVVTYLEYMQIDSTIEFDITEPEATYADFKVYLAQAYGKQAIEVIILLHKRAIIQMLFAEDEQAMETIKEDCIAEIEQVATLSDDRDAYALQKAKSEAAAKLSDLVNVDNKRKYTDANWQMLEITVSGALSGIDAAESIGEVQSILAAAEENIEAIERGNYNWIVVLIALVLGLSTTAVIAVFAIVIKQQRLLRARSKKKVA